VVAFAERAKTMKDALYAIRKSATAQGATPAVYTRHGSRKKEQSFRPKRQKPAQPPNQRTLFDDLGTVPPTA
jgi:hypothetical protein